MALLAAWRKLRWSLAHRGLAATLRVALGALQRPAAPASELRHPFDERYGTDTGGLLGGGSLATGSRNDAHITAYAGIAPSRLAAALRQWEGSLPPGDTAESFTFLDLGAGKGRALLLASERPFRRTVGVELNPQLAASAQSNVRTFSQHAQMCSTPEIRCADATEIAYPDGPLLIFIYNSFGVPVLRAVLQAVEQHVRVTGARVDLIYQNEGPETPLRADRRLQQLWTGSLALSAEDAAADPVASPEDVTGLYRWIA